MSSHSTYAYILALGAFLLSAPCVEAEDYVRPGILICNTPDEVKAFYTRIADGEEPHVANKAVPGCGKVMQPFRVHKVIRDPFIAGNRRVHIVEFTFLEGNLGTQFGVYIPRTVSI